MIEVIHGSALSLLPGALPVDHVFCDPPYSPEVHRNATTSADRAFGTKHNDFGFDPIDAELMLHVAKHVAAATRWSLIHTDVESMHLWKAVVEQAGGKYIRSIPWVRWSTPQKSGDRPVQGFELVLLFWGSQSGSKRVHWHGPGNLVELEHECYLEELDALRHKCLRGPGKHKTEKPLDQALDLIDWFTEPGSTILDLTCGRGTYGAAAALVGERNFAGIELDEQEALLAQARVADAVKGVVSDRDAVRVKRWLENRNVTNRPATKRKDRVD